MKDKYEYEDMKDAVEKIHGRLTEIKEQFNGSVDALKDMQRIGELIRITLGDRLLPLTTDPELKRRIERLEYTDERFVMKLSHILNRSGGEERLDLLVTCATELCALFAECKSKRDKLEERRHLLDRFVEQDGKRIENPEWLVTNRKLNEMTIAQSKLGIKMNFVVRKFFATRKQTLNRVIGLSEQLFDRLKREGQDIGDQFFKTYGVRQIAEELIETDKKGARK